MIKLLMLLVSFSVFSEGSNIYLNRWITKLERDNWKCPQSINKIKTREECGENCIYVPLAPCSAISLKVHDALIVDPNLLKLAPNIEFENIIRVEKQGKKGQFLMSNGDGTFKWKTIKADALLED